MKMLAPTPGTFAFRMPDMPEIPDIPSMEWSGGVLAGGHPRSLEYLDALLSGGTARYPDVTRRLREAIDRRLSGADRSRWLA